MSQAVNLRAIAQYLRKRCLQTSAVSFYTPQGRMVDVRVQGEQLQGLQLDSQSWVDLDLSQRFWTYWGETIDLPGAPSRAPA